MKLILLLTVAVAATAILATTASAARITKHDRDVIRFFQHHPRLARTPSGAASLAKILPRVIRSLQAADAAASNPYPPHHALWECIHRYEGSWDSRAGQTGPGQYGGLQMSWDWLGYVDGNAGNLPEATQEWAAEKAWAANGYSYGFLYGQWYEWDAADGCGTTG